MFFSSAASCKNRHHFWCARKIFSPYYFVTSLVQGQPLGFDTKYLALADRNMQVRFSLKVVWES